LDSRHFYLPDLVECVNFLDWERFLAPARIEYLLWVAIKKKPPATGAQGALFRRTAWRVFRAAK
jgi:hypothetical protein